MWSMSNNGEVTCDTVVVGSGSVTSFGPSAVDVSCDGRSALATLGVDICVSLTSVARFLAVFPLGKSCVSTDYSVVVSLGVFRW